MKHIKQYPPKKYIPKPNEPHEGDYVLCTRKSTTTTFLDFIENHIGQILNIVLAHTYTFQTDKDNKPLYTVQYFDYNITSSTSPGVLPRVNCNREEIIHFSPNREDLEVILSANKYNL